MEFGFYGKFSAPSDIGHATFQVDRSTRSGRETIKVS